jgi:hypothetical protein
VNAACCQGHTCGPNAICLNDGLCHACGGLHQLCCLNNTCNGYTCVPASPPQCACGGKNEACCPGASCNPGYTCQSGICSAPGNPQPLCVGVGGACGTSTGPFCCPGELCTYGTCKACINHGDRCGAGYGEICCSWQDACVLDQFTETEQCNIRDQNTP